MHTQLYPINFSIPSCKVIKDIPVKKKFVANIVPNKPGTYIYTTEQEYYKDYQDSLFGITVKKGGWDCLRHYEIMANGCIPYFENIEDCPKNTLTLLPKNLLLKGNTLYKKIAATNMNNNIESISASDLIECYELINVLLIHLREYLTTDKLVKYILEKSKHQNVSNVLYISSISSPNYLRCLTLHGFKTLFGTNCHDFIQIPHLYKSYNLPDLYGKGFTYAYNLDDSLKSDISETIVLDNIKNNYYDIVIYGDLDAGTPYYDIIQHHYAPEKVIFLVGGDTNNGNYNWVVYKGHPIFVRELY